MCGIPCKMHKHDMIKIYTIFFELAGGVFKSPHPHSPPLHPPTPPRSIKGLKYPGS